MDVVVAPPRVWGHRVHFRFELSEPTTTQRRNRWSVSFPGTSLRGIPRELLLENFLALQLPVWAVQDPAATVRLPMSMPRAVVEWWLAYHRLDTMTVGPLSDDAPVTLEGLPRRGSSAGRTAVMFGGGKDSTLAYEALAEKLGADRVLLVHMVHPFSARRGASSQAQRRAERQILAPLRRRGAEIKVVRTDFIANLRAHAKVRPGVLLYFGAALAGLIAADCAAATVSHTAGGYWVKDRVGKPAMWGNRRLRPEWLETLSDYYEVRLGRPLELSTTHYAVSEYLSFATLLERYPAALDGVVMCMREPQPGRRWCYDCKKCFEYAVFGLSRGYVDGSFDYQTMFTARYTTGLHKHAKTAPRDERTGLALWSPRVGTPTHFASMCHALHHLDPSLLVDRVDSRVLKRLVVLRGAYGTTSFPAVETIVRAAIDLPRAQAARIVAEVAAEHHEVVPEQAGPLLRGDEPVGYAYGTRMPVDLPVPEAGSAERAAVPAASVVRAPGPTVTGPFEG
ncbi:hypothetical protein [Oerskovia flava]|uniref:hypothetical protein n=1 Tax=Oerskovia flava TaxID=2986422 RepID=UPI00223FB850|nr:hypothetical protein [Oerskovia sp. JB1-3-2]